MPWLIEYRLHGQTVSYYCAPGEWCSNPNHAHRFATRQEAEVETFGLPLQNYAVEEHAWDSPESSED
jgi:hypothetical protein